MVHDTLDRFTDTPLIFCSEITLSIHQVLMANCALEDVKRVYSRPEALLQCRAWLKDNLPGVELLPIKLGSPGFPTYGFDLKLVHESTGAELGTGEKGVLVAVPPLPHKLMISIMIPRWRKAELAVEALRSGDRDLLLHYLLEDQRTRSLDQAEALLEEWLADPRNERVARLFG